MILRAGILYGSEIFRFLDGDGVITLWTVHFPTRPGSRRFHRFAAIDAFEANHDRHPRRENGNDWPEYHQPLANTTGAIMYKIYLNITHIMSGGK